MEQSGRKFAKGSSFKSYKLSKVYLLFGSGKDKWINAEKVNSIL